MREGESHVSLATFGQMPSTLAAAEPGKLSMTPRTVFVVKVNCFTEKKNHSEAYAHMGGDKILL